MNVSDTTAEMIALIALFVALVLEAFAARIALAAACSVYNVSLDLMHAFPFTEYW